MAYSTIGFKDGTTPLDATNFNKMDEQIKQNADDIDGLSDDLTNITRNYTGTVDDMLSDWTALPSRVPTLFSCTGETAQFLTNSSTSNRWNGIVIQNGTTCTFFLYSTGSALYWGSASTSSKEVTALRSVSGTSALSTSATGDPVVMEDDA